MKKARWIALLLISLSFVFSFVSNGATYTASPSKATVLINGKLVAFEAYTINGNNYFKLRDLAFALRGTAKSFSVTWNSEKNSIFIASGSDYQPVGGELTLSPSLIPKAAKTTMSNIYVNNTYAYFTAYGISGNNYFKLRDVAEELNFGVAWDGAAKTIRIDTANEYVSDDGKSILTNETSFAGTYPMPFEPGYFKGYDHPQVVAAIGDVSVSTDPRSMTFSYPLDPSISRTLMVKNNGTEEVFFEYNPSISIVEFQSQMFINHPQPFRFYLQPGQTQPVRLLYAMNLGPDNSGRLSAPITAECIVRTLADYNGQRRTVKLDNDVQIVGIHGTSPPTSPYEADPNEPAANATISGTLFDGLSHKTLDDVEVSVFNGRSAVAARTNSKGMFSIPVYAHQRVGTNVWSEYAVLANGLHEFTKDNMFAGYHKNLAGVELADYGQARQVITIKSGEKANLKLELFPRRQTAGHKVESILDIGLQAYEFDCTQDGNIFATVPFHTGLLSDVRAKYAFLNVFDLNGKLLWKKAIHDETPTVDISKDGSLIATTIQQIPEPGSVSMQRAQNTAVVYDDKGNLLFEFLSPVSVKWNQEYFGRIMEVQISDDNRYLAVGDDEGRVYLINLATKEIIWKKELNGQVRILRFDDTGGFRLISSSGDGFLRAYDINGNLKWETYADAWLTNISISEHYILTASKATQSPVHLINKVTGKTIYSYPMEQIGQEIIISPDETLFWYGNATGGGTTTLKGTLFSINGKPIFDVGNGTLSAAFTADSQYLAVMNEKCVAVYNRSGQILWTQDMLIDRARTSLNDVMWISPDASRIVAGLNTKPESNYYGQIYFFKGGVTDLVKN